MLGLVSSGLATLEGLIQSISTTLTSDILGVFFWKKTDAEARQRRLIAANKWVIAGLALATFVLARNQLLYPRLSVGIFAQLGVYAFFSAAFVPVLFGIFLKNTPRAAVVAASLTALAVHFGSYFGGVTPYLQGAVRNPAVSSAMAIVSALAVGLIVHFFLKKSQA